MDDFKIQWSESLRVGQSAIDEQHRKLILLVEAVSESQWVRKHILVDDKKIGLFLKRQGG